MLMLKMYAHTDSGDGESFVTVTKVANSRGEFAEQAPQRPGTARKAAASYSFSCMFSNRVKSEA